MKGEEVYPNLYYFGFNTQKKLGDSFKRFYGYYESPALHKKIFTEKQFDFWFKHKTEFGKDLGLCFSDIAGGINVPEWVFSPFIGGKFDPLNKDEKEIINFIKTIEKERYYVIGSISNNWFDLKHEIAHGIYYLNKNYKEEINSFLLGIKRNEFDKMENYLKLEGVTCEENIVDEIHAQLLTNHYVFFNNIKENSLKNIMKK